MFFICLGSAPINAYLSLHTGKNHWRDIHPNIEDLPDGWPGRGLEHGLRLEHLIPSRKLFHLSFV
jgi:hypothetical protein